MNPITQREIRSRWRDNRSFVFLFSYTAVLAALVGLFYSGEYTSSQAGDMGQQLQRAGRSIFEMLSWVGTLGWLLVAPALTASSVTYERERGLLDHLMLAPLTPGAIARGKLVAGLAFGVELLVCTLPFMAITFLLGGVSPEEFWMVTMLHGTTAVFCAVVGLACSAVSYRSNMALRSAYGLVIFWLLTSFVAGVISGAGVVRVFLPGGTTTVTAYLMLYAQTNPVSASLDWNGPGAAGVTAEPWKISVAFQLTLGLGFYLLALYALKRPLKEQQWMERKKVGKKQRASHFHLPLIHKLQFTNPVLNREVRGKFRMRQPSVWAIIGEVLMGLLVGYYYLYALYLAWFDPMQREMIWYVITLIGIVVVMMSSGVMGANSFARERENGTWEGVELSLLHAKEIVVGKLGAALLACLVFSVPFWPLLIPCVDWVSFPSEHRGVSGQKLGLDVAVACVLIFMTTAFSFTSFGMLISWHMRRTSAAVGWTLGILFGLVVLFPIIVGIVGNPSQDFMMFVIGTTNPVGTLVMTSQGGNTEAPYISGVPFAVVTGLAGLTALAQLCRSIDESLSKVRDEVKVAKVG